MKVPKSMRKLLITQFKDNNQLRDYTSKSAHLRSTGSRRSVVNIAVIDDKPFAPQANLRSYGYKIDAIGDIKLLSEVAPYHMVLCDIIGVGQHFDRNIQGASLIAEIKKTYPEKVVIAYTGAAMNDRSAKIAGLRADTILKKDIDLEDWTTALDKYCVEAIDPYTIWNKIRKRFVELDISTTDIMLLEDAYVRSIEKNDSTLSPLANIVKNVATQNDVRSIIQGLISSMIFKVIIGQ